ncbi:MAG: hypothetical protein J6C60_02490 [Alistipes sp.]|nr:hypothetical protein [Alistipes sp.]MBO5399478.1 hypothetical protein [Alistipes sp.]
MEKKKVWKDYLVLILAIIIVGFNLYDYINYREIDWFYACLGVVMIFSSIFGIKNAKREISKEK